MLFLSAILFVPACQDGNGVIAPVPAPVDTPTPLRIYAFTNVNSVSVWVWRADQPVDDATVTLNGVAVPHAIGDSTRYERSTTTLAAGSPIVLEVRAGGATVQATGNMPEAPVLTAPAPGTVFALTDSITVTWTSATDPDSFEIFMDADFCCGPGVQASGTARGLKIAAADLGISANGRLILRATNDGSITGHADPESRMTISNGGSAEATITISAAQLGISADLSALDQFILVSQAGRDVTDAVVRVNGVAMRHVGDGGAYSGQLPQAAPPGSLLDLEVSANGATVKANGIVPAAPLVTAPATGSFFPLADSITFTWTSETNPDAFGVAVGSVFPALFRARAPRASSKSPPPPSGRESTQFPSRPSSTADRSADRRSRDPG